MRAEEGVARRDWKFAIDCLQRIIDDPQGSLVPRSGEATDGVFLYESARREALRRLTSLPPEGLRAYRLLFDGKARRLLERAKVAYDPQPLHVAVDRYLLTRYGDDAADLLASWALDAGRPGEAVLVLTDLTKLVPDCDVPERLIVAKLAAAYALLGRAEDARSVIEAYRTRGDGDGEAKEFPLSSAILKLNSEGLDRADDRASWPVFGGSATRRGRMPDVNPTLSERVPWRADLPGAGSNAWRRMLHDDPSGPLTLPIPRLVADGRRLFARTRSGCVALSMEDLDIEWQSEVVALTAPSVEPQRRRRKSRASLKASDADFAFEDQVAGGIALADGLVLIVSREGSSEYTQGGRDFARGGLLSWLPRPRAPRRDFRGSQLVAYDAHTGDVRWRRGRSGRPDDPLDGVEFGSVPILVDGVLWVAFLRQGELNVGVLDPADGALVRSIPLCQAGGTVPIRHALHPAAADGQVFVACDCGVLFALDASDYTIRWAGEYGPFLTEQRSSRTDRAADGWLSTGLTATGGLVLVTPEGHEELLAFAAVDGQLRWSTRCEGASYVIAADHGRVWVGGRKVSCLALSDGEPVWDRDIASSPSGHAVLAGESVHVPTLDGLLSLDAGTGEVLGSSPMSVSHGPLCNLLCLGGAMFSINPSCVRKFPDLERTYPTALAQHESNPADPVAAARLARLELMRDEPQRAYEVLDAIPSGVLKESGPRADNVAHLRVEALLAMAGRSQSAGRTHADVLELLEQADRAARCASDRLRTGQAIAEQLKLLGRDREAFRRLWRLGIGPDADRMVSWGDHVEGEARLAIARRLREIAAGLSARQLEELREFARNGLPQGAERPAERARLRAVADLRVLDSISQRAVTELAAHHALSARYEQAELLFRDAVRLAAEPDLTLAAQMGLCRIYAIAAAAGLESVATLDTSLRALGARFGSLSVPSSVRSLGWAAFDADPGASVEVWIEAMRSSFPAADPQGLSGCETRAPMQLTDEIAWSLEAPANGDVPRVVRFSPGATQTLTDRIAVISPGDIVSCYRASDGELLWKTTLRLPGTFVDIAPIRWRQGEGGARHAAADGQTAVFAGRDGIFAVGLGTGRRIWCEPYGPGDGTRLPSASDIAMSADEGLLATTVRSGRLALMRLLDGSTVWEHDLLGERVARIWMPPGRVVTANPRLARVHVFRRDDGTLIKRVLFQQPDPRNLLVDLPLVDGVLCGPAVVSGSDAVAAVDVRTGEEAWNLPLDKPLVQLFTPAEGYVGLGLLGGDVRIVSAATGESVLDRRVAGAHAVLRGAMVDGTLVVQYHTVEHGVSAVALASLDVATGAELWRREDAVPLWPTGRPLRVIGGHVPVLLRGGSSGRGAGRKVTLAMIDIRTGSVVGEEVALPPRRNARLNGDFEVFEAPQVAVIGTTGAIHALRTVSLPEGAQGDF